MKFTSFDGCAAVAFYLISTHIIQIARSAHLSIFVYLHIIKRDNISNGAMFFSTSLLLQLLSTPLLVEFSK